MASWGINSRLLLSLWLVMGGLLGLAPNVAQAKSAADALRECISWNSPAEITKNYNVWWKNTLDGADRYGGYHADTGRLSFLRVNTIYSSQMLDGGCAKGIGDYTRGASFDETGWKRAMNDGTAHSSVLFRKITATVQNHINKRKAEFAVDVEYGSPRITNPKAALRAMQGQYFGYKVRPELLALERQAFAELLKYAKAAQATTRNSGKAKGAAGNQGCAFSACGYGKQRCCQMAREQLRQCQSADRANKGGYQKYGTIGEMSSDAIKECVRCSQVWLRNNRC